MSNQPAAATTRTSELHLGRPDNFDGSSSKASAWMDSVNIYLMINRAIYDSNKKNVTFTLSFMKKGSATIWASTLDRKSVV